MQTIEIKTKYDGTIRYIIDGYEFHSDKNKQCSICQTLQQYVLESDQYSKDQYKKICLKCIKLLFKEAIQSTEMQKVFLKKMIQKERDTIELARVRKHKLKQKLQKIKNINNVPFVSTLISSQKATRKSNLDGVKGQTKWIIKEQSYYINLIENSTCTICRNDSRTMDFFSSRFCFKCIKAMFQKMVLTENDIDNLLGRIESKNVKRNEKKELKHLHQVKQIEALQKEVKSSSI